jgi:AraC-like DNA-binding protein
VISEGAPFRDDVAGRVVTASSFVVGMFDRPALTAVEGSAWGVQVDLDPGAAYALTGGNVCALTNRVTSVSEVTTLDVDRILERVASARTRRVASAALDEELTLATGAGPTLSPRVRAAWDLIRSEPGASIGSVSERVGCTRSQLVKLFHAQIGLAPKTVSRLGRFRCALGLLETSPSLADLAAIVGYADQAHMTREFRAFAGATPGQLRTSARGAPFIQDRPDDAS